MLSAVSYAETTFKARITYYYGHDRVAWSKVQKPVEGSSVAAHPDFKFGTKILIDGLKNIVGDGIFTVHDRGPAVTKKVASKGKLYVFDVFISDKAKYKKLSKSKNNIMDVKVLK